MSAYWSHAARGWVITPHLSERRIRLLEWTGHANDYIDWFVFNDAWGLFKEGAD